MIMKRFFHVKYEEHKEMEAARDPNVEPQTTARQARN